MATENKPDEISIDGIGNIIPPESKAVPEIVSGISDTINKPPETAPQNSAPVSDTQNVDDLDADGVAWNPAIHFPDKRKTKLGKWRKRKDGMNETTGNTAPQCVTTSIPPDVAGKSFAALFFGIGCGLLGEEFAPTGTSEKEMVEIPFTKFCAETGVKDLPPSIALALALVAYTANKVATKKTVKEKLMEKASAIMRLFKRG
jgi:hypothetical protein